MTTEETTPVAAPFDGSVRPLTAGDIVRLKNPDNYIVSFAKKAADRDAEVLWVGPTALNMFHGQACVKFLKRNGRGKEFQEVLYVRDLVRVKTSA